MTFDVVDFSVSFRNERQNPNANCILKEMKPAKIFARAHEENLTTYILQPQKGGLCLLD